MDGTGDPAQRHVRRLTGRHDVVVGHRRRLRHGDELRSGRPRRQDGPFPGPRRAVRGLRARRCVARPAGLGPGPARRRRAGSATSLRQRVPAHLGEADPEAVLTGIYTGAIPYARLFELARVLLDAAADGDALARQVADTLADEAAAFVRAAVLRLGLEDEAVEVVLGGGVFDTTDAAFHERFAAGVRAAAPRASLVRLDVPPVVGAALIGLDAIGAPRSALSALRQRFGPDPTGGRRPTPTAARRHLTAAGGGRAAANDGRPSVRATPPPRRQRASRRRASARRRPAVVGHLLHHLDHLGVLLGVPPFEELGQPASGLASVSCRSPSSGRRQVEVALGPPAAFLDHARGHQPVDAGWISSGSTFRRWATSVTVPAGLVGQPVEKPAGPGAAGRARPARPG